MSQRPIVLPSQRAAPPARGLSRAFGIAQGVLSLGMLADWAYGGFADGTKLASGAGFALMMPLNLVATRDPAAPRAARLKALCVLGLVLALGATVARHL
jgi:hypothetical protein